jgi:hypothetical protein
MEHKQTVRVSRAIISFAVIVAAAAAVILPVSAATYGSGNVQNYAATAPLDNGTIVQLAGSGSNNVKIASQKELQNMFGVTVDRNQVAVTLSKSGLENVVYVAVSGVYNVLVSTQNGAIKLGDYVTLSSVNGVAMKASTEQKTVLGRATGSFDGKSLTLGTTALKDTTGKNTKTVTLGSIPVAIDIKHNPEDKSTKANLPEMLQRLGKAVAEKEVSPIRIYLSMGITGVSIIAAIAILYVGVRQAIIAVGRNPMSKKSIFRALLEVILTSILILIIGLFAVYLLLKL